jgi:hypothetical protein
MTKKNICLIGTILIILIFKIIYFVNYNFKDDIIFFKKYIQIKQILNSKKTEKLPEHLINSKFYKPFSKNPFSIKEFSNEFIKLDEAEKTFSQYMINLMTDTDYDEKFDINQRKGCFISYGPIPKNLGEYNRIELLAASLKLKEENFVTKEIYPHFIFHNGYKEKEKKFLRSYTNLPIVFIKVEQIFPSEKDMPFIEEICKTQSFINSELCERKGELLSIKGIKIKNN